MSHRAYTEAPETYMARKKIKEIFRPKLYKIEEYKGFPEITNNMGEEIWPPYEADMFLSKAFIIELDPQRNEPYKSKGHGTRKKRIHDQWRDRNFKDQINIPTVRLIPEDVNRMTEEQILKDIRWQLKNQSED